MRRFVSLLGLIVYTLKIFSSASSKCVISNAQELQYNEDVVVKSIISLGECQTINLRCDNPVDIQRRDYTIACNNKQKIEGTEYYCSKKCIEVGNKEKLLIPSDVILFDENKTILPYANGRFQPTKYSTKVYFGSKQRRTFKCCHNIIFYESSDRITIPQGKGVLLPQNCMLINEKGDTILYDGFYYPKEEDKGIVRILSKQSMNVEIVFVPVVKLSSHYQFTFEKGGMLRNGIIVCDDMRINAKQSQIFDNIVLTGTLNNTYLTVEWFGCNTQNDGLRNKEILQQYLIPSAVACSVDVYHSSKGKYEITGAYPVNNALWSFDHFFIRDFNSITIYGAGLTTVIYECLRQKKNPSDVFNIVDSRNLSIKKLSVTHQAIGSDIDNGSNAFSLVHSNENIVIEGCQVYSMPYKVGASYPDGGKAFTIQAGPNTNQRNIEFRNNQATSVSYGLDYTKTSYSEADVLENVVFDNNNISQAIVGALVHEWNSPYGEEINPVLVQNNTLTDCQVGVLCQTSKSCSITNNRISNGKRPTRLLYYDGVYGIYTLGAYNTIIEGNQINLKDGDAFMNIGVYSYYPQFNGSVKNMTVTGNSMRGVIKDKPVRVGKDSMTKTESKMLDGIIVSGNSIQHK